MCCLLQGVHGVSRIPHELNLLGLEPGHHQPYASRGKVPLLVPPEDEDSKRVQLMWFLHDEPIKDVGQCFGLCGIRVFPRGHHPILSFGRSPFLEETENFLIILCGVPQARRVSGSVCFRPFIDIR